MEAQFEKKLQSPVGTRINPCSDGKTAFLLQLHIRSPGHFEPNRHSGNDILVLSWY
jgi:hypothetical protein